MATKLGAVFSGQILGDGTTTSFNFNLSDGAIAITPLASNFNAVAIGEPDFPKEFDVTTATGTMFVTVNGGLTISSSSVSSGIVTVVLTTPIPSGEVLQIQGGLLYGS